MRDEVEIEISAMILAIDDDEDMLYRSRIEVLVLDRRFWVLVMESKQTNFSLLKAIPR